MATSLDKYREDLDRLVKKGESLLTAMQYSCFPKRFDEMLGEKKEEFVKSLPDFDNEYQTWYSEAKVVVKQLLPDRLDDFVQHYEKPKSRKDITYENYRIADYLQGLNITRGPGKEIVVRIPAHHEQ